MLFDSRARAWESKWKQKRATRSHVAPVINVRVNSRLVRDRKMVRYDTGRCGMAFRIVKPIRTEERGGPAYRVDCLSTFVFIRLCPSTRRATRFTLSVLERGCLAYCTIIRYDMCRGCVFTNIHIHAPTQLDDTTKLDFSFYSIFFFFIWIKFYIISKKITFYSFIIFINTFYF